MSLVSLIEGICIEEVVVGRQTAVRNDEDRERSAAKEDGLLAVPISLVYKDSVIKPGTNII